MLQACSGSWTLTFFGQGGCDWRSSAHQSEVIRTMQSLHCLATWMYLLKTHATCCYLIETHQENPVINLVVNIVEWDLSESAARALSLWLEAKDDDIKSVLFARIRRGTVDHSPSGGDSSQGVQVQTCRLKNRPMFLVYSQRSKSVAVRCWNEVHLLHFPRIYSQTGTNRSIGYQYRHDAAWLIVSTLTGT
ncbi:uncharacterized protein LY79DRAFT_268097 [Colletotrichum navitas]|uniref:Uncharacterized protein n=1 Tax=Colletotrichum navitas TaxID=681940 RepID=A0AAD8V328_9PEZI|nr:uncharacterized protein LY79DRAFT_268097 [Colletotrichum navitas]KAK1585427.1 hypothetical protein LY79DRAFT_268097 [Colletotrichum navitas]